MKKFLTFDGRRVEVNIFGDKKHALVFLAGWTHDFQYETELIEALTKECRVITISYPGYSGSEVNPKARSMDFLSKLVDQVIESLGLTNFTLIGFSMGCQVALNYITKHPKQKAILISPVTHSLLDDSPTYIKFIVKSKSSTRGRWSEISLSTTLKSFTLILLLINI